MTALIIIGVIALIVVIVLVMRGKINEEGGQSKYSNQSIHDDVPEKDSVYAPQETNAEPDEDPMIKQARERAEAIDASLRTLNLEIRKNGLPVDVITKIESVIDKLLVLVPWMNNDHIGTQCTITVNAAAERYVNDLVGPYVRLSSDKRIERSDEITESLQKVAKELDRIKDMADRQVLDEFDAESSFLNSKFGTTEA